MDRPLRPSCGPCLPVSTATVFHPASFRLSAVSGEAGRGRTSARRPPWAGAASDALWLTCRGPGAPAPLHPPPQLSGLHLAAPDGPACALFLPGFPRPFRVPRPHSPKSPPRPSPAPPAAQRPPRRFESPRGPGPGQPSPLTGCVPAGRPRPGSDWPPHSRGAAALRLADCRVPAGMGAAGVAQFPLTGAQRDPPLCLRGPEAAQECPPGALAAAVPAWVCPSPALALCSPNVPPHSEPGRSWRRGQSRVPWPSSSAANSGRGLPPPRHGHKL